MFKISRIFFFLVLILLQESVTILNIVIIDRKLII